VQFLQHYGLHCRDVSHKLLQCDDLTDADLPLYFSFDALSFDLHGFHDFCPLPHLGASIRQNTFECVDLSFGRLQRQFCRKVVGVLPGGEKCFGRVDVLQHFLDSALKQSDVRARGEQFGILHQFGPAGRESDRKAL